MRKNWNTPTSDSIKRSLNTWTSIKIQVYKKMLVLLLKRIIPLMLNCIMVY